MLQAWLTRPATVPTSQITGGGAIGDAECKFSRHVGDRPSFLVPSATLGMRAALAALGVRSGSEVIIPTIDWPSTLAAVLSLGATPVLAPVDPETSTIDPGSLEHLRTRRTRVVVASHLHGVAADVPAIRAAIHGDIQVLEDCAQALGSTLDGVPVGMLGDAAVFSFGPTKTICVGEVGMVVARDRELWESLVRESAHPVRQWLETGEDVAFDRLSVRPHPLAAILLSESLRTWAPAALRDRNDSLRAKLWDDLGIPEFGLDERRRSAEAYVPIRLRDIWPSTLAGIEVRASGQLDLRTMQTPMVARLGLATELPSVSTTANGLRDHSDGK